jgi:hypothetical protein
MSDTVAPTPASAPSSPLPLFYTRPVPVDASRHKTKFLRDNPGYGFSARTNSVPVSGAEFVMIQRHYPIVFSGRDKMLPVAVVGLRPDENLCVDAEGKWLPHAYIPAYVRRYPFVFIEAAGGQLILGIDEGSGIVVDDGKLPLFDAAGKPSQLVNSALQFCAAYQGNHKATAEYVEALKEADLLVDHQAQATIAGTERLSLAGFRVVDETRFNKLPAATLETWRNKGWLAWTYAHLMSFACWNMLARLAAERKKAP